MSQGEKDMCNKKDTEKWIESEQEKERESNGRELLQEQDIQ